MWKQFEDDDLEFEHNDQTNGADDHRQLVHE
jgi:hypothetical protein